MIELNFSNTNITNEIKTVKFRIIQKLQDQYIKEITGYEEAKPSTLQIEIPSDILFLGTEIA